MRCALASRRVLTEQSASIAFGTPLHVASSGLAALRQVSAKPVVEDGVIKSWAVERPQLLNDMVVLFNAASELVTAAIVPLSRALIRLRPSWRRALRNSREHMQRRIDAARAEAEASGGWPERPDNVLDLMLSKADSSEEKLSDSALQDEAMLFLVAVRLAASTALIDQGSETTATTLAHGFKLLARHPDVQRKLHAELEAKFDPKDPASPTYAELNDPSLHYLAAVEAEILRCARTVGATLREGAPRDPARG